MKHVVVAIISRNNKNEKDEFLLVSSKRNFGEYSGFYYPPGGHMEKGENEKAALAREIKEELNLNIEPIEKITETSSDIKEQTTHWWRCKIKSGEIKIRKIDNSKIYMDDLISEQFTKTQLKELFDRMDLKSKISELNSISFLCELRK